MRALDVTNCLSTKQRLWQPLLTHTESLIPADLLTLPWPVHTSGGQVLVLGCAPGGWLQVACQLLGPPARGGAVLGLDIQARPRCTLCML